jgi:hypothetical protein
MFPPSGRALGPVDPLEIVVVDAQQRTCTERAVQGANDMECRELALVPAMRNRLGKASVAQRLDGIAV